MVALSSLGCSQRGGGLAQAGLSLHLIRGTKLENPYYPSDELLPRLRQTARACCTTHIITNVWNRMKYLIL